VPQSVTVRMPSMEGDEAGGGPDRPGSAGRERDTSVQSVSFSDDVDVPMNQPVQSVTVRQKNG